MGAFEDFLQAGAGYYMGQEGIQGARDIGQRGYDEAMGLATDVAGKAEFKPFTVSTGLSTATTTPEGGYTLNLSPEQQALQTGALGQAQTFMTGMGQDPMSQLLSGQAQQAYAGLGPSALTGMGVSGYQAVGQDPMQREILTQARERFQGIGADPRQQALLAQSEQAFAKAGLDSSTAQADLYEQMRAAQRPEEERQRLALEERMLSQGRMGLQSAAYGGSSPELLAQETARQEAMARANLSARQQAVKEQQQAFGQGLGLLGQASGLRAQDLAEATGLLGAGYTPEQRELTRAGALFGAGMTQEQADLARAQSLLGASYMPRTQDLAMATGLMGLGYTPQEQALATLGMGTKTAGLADIGRRTGAELYGRLGQSGVESLIQGEDLANRLQLQQMQSLSDSLFGRQPTTQEQILGQLFDVDTSGDGGLIDLIRKYTDPSYGEEGYVYHPSEYDEDFTGPTPF